MNMSDAKSELKVSGWVGQFRPVWSAVYMTVGKPDQPEYFKTSEQAECAAWRALRNIEQPVMVRAGDRCQAAKSAAERLFIGGGKVVGVERRRVGA